MKKELIAIQEQFDTQAAASEAKLAAKDAEIAELRSFVKLQKIVDNKTEIAEAAKNADKSVDDYLFEILDKALNPKMPLLPMPQTLYERFLMIAHMRSISLVDLMLSDEEVIRCIGNALDNIGY